MMDLKAEEQGLRKLHDRLMEEVYERKDIEAWEGFMVEDVIFHASGVPSAVGKKAARAIVEGLFHSYVSVNAELTRVEVSSSGDMAYNAGSYRLVLKEPAGQVDEGTFFNVFSRVDNEWKYLLASICSNKPAL